MSVGFDRAAIKCTVTETLGTLADIVQPRTFEELERYGFDALPEAPAASDDNTPGRLDRWPAEP